MSGTTELAASSPTVPAVTTERSCMPDPLAVAPVASAPSPIAPDDDLLRLLTGFRSLQVQHNRVLGSEGAARGLGPTDTRLLLLLAANGSAAVTPKQAAEHLELSTGAMTSLVDRLEKHGHIERLPNPDDRRSILVQLTASGSAVAQQIGGVYSAAFREVVPVAERARLAEAFELLGQALDRHSPATSN
jgi:DNA-binding MarR family transcriptional regulator